MNKPFGELKVALARELTQSDCKTVSTMEDIPPAQRERIKDGLSLLSALEQRNVFSEDDVSYLVDLFTRCDLFKAASVARDYQSKSGQNRSNNPLGKMKIAVASQLTTADCQAVATMAGLPPARREQMKDGITLMNSLESRGVYNQNDVSQLQELLRNCDLLKAAKIVKEYHDNNNSVGATPDPSFVQDIPVNQVPVRVQDIPVLREQVLLVPNVQQDIPQGSSNAHPNLELEHMNHEIPTCKLAEVAGVMGARAKNFAMAHLKLSDVEIENCEYNTRTLEDRNYYFLKSWKDKIGTKATYKKLCEKLCKAGFSEKVWRILEVPEEDDD